MPTTHKTILSGKPATVEIEDDSSIQLTDHYGILWAFTSELKPDFFRSGTLETVFTFEDKKITTHSRMGEMVCAGETEISTDNTYLTNFWKALDAIESIKNLPAPVKQKFVELRKEDQQLAK